MSTSIPPSLSRHPLSHPLLPAPTATYHPQQPSPSRMSASPHSPPHTSMPNQNPTTHPTKCARREQHYPLPHRPPLQRVPQHPPFPTACPNPAGPQFYPPHQPRRRSHLLRPLRRLHQPGLSTAPSALYPYPRATRTPSAAQALPRDPPVPHHRAPVLPLYHTHPLAHQARGPHAISARPTTRSGASLRRPRHLPPPPALSTSSGTTSSAVRPSRRRRRHSRALCRCPAAATERDAPAPGEKLGGPRVGGGEEARDTTMWLEYLAGSFFCPCPAACERCLRSDGRSLMRGGGRSTLTRGRRE